MATRYSVIFYRAGGMTLISGLSYYFINKKLAEINETIVCNDNLKKEINNLKIKNAELDKILKQQEEIHKLILKKDGTDAFKKQI